MYLKTVVILLAAVNNLSADFGTDIENKLSEENRTAVYYKGSKVQADENHCREHICLNKCCPFGQTYHAENKRCLSTLKVFDINLLVQDEYLRIQNEKADEFFYFKIKTVFCEENEVRFKISTVGKRIKKKYVLRTDGKLYVDVPQSIPPWFIAEPDSYCIDNFVVENADGTKTTEVDALVCSSPDPISSNNYIISSTCMLISCVFILATVAVYTWLPQLHNIHGRVLIAYLLCLFVGFIFLASMQLLIRSDSITPKACVGMTFVIYFSLLSAFFWLNVMCFDIWRVFGGKREMRLEKMFVRSKLRAYAMYAFGVPTLLTILVVSLEFSGLPPSPWMPNLRYQGCFLSGKSKLFYLYGPIVILCAANMTLFILTALKIAKTKKEVSVLKSRDSARSDQQNNDTQRLFLYVKLFILMGINWILEVLSSLYPSEYWLYTDAYNVLIGLIIFIIFVCKRKIMQLLKERYKAMRRDPVSQSQTSWSRATSSKDEMALTTR